MASKGQLISKGNWYLQFFHKINLKILIFAPAYWGRNFSFVFWKNWKSQIPFEINWPLSATAHWTLNLWKTPDENTRRGHKTKLTGEENCHINQEHTFRCGKKDSLDYSSLLQGNSICFLLIIYIYIICYNKWPSNI